MSAIGTLLAALLGLALALPAAGRLGWPAQYGARLLLNALRAVPELVWAALVVLAAGLGPNAGTLALALHTAGVLGRLFAEALENSPHEPAAAIRLAGGGHLTAFCYGTLPTIWPQLIAYSLYRWENNIRMASVLGFVGAGGWADALRQPQPVPGGPGRHRDPGDAGTGAGRRCVERLGTPALGQPLEGRRSR